MNSNLMPLLSSISKLPINAFQIDTKNDVIKLNFDYKDKSSDVKEITFNEVTSFYYLDHENHDNDSEHASLNNIMYCGPYLTDYIDIPDEDDVAVSVPNFIIELNDSNIFIEANSIVINETTYVV